MMKKYLIKIYYKTISMFNDKKYKIKKFYKSFFYWILGFKSEEIQNISSECIIICAHPDDETIFFSSVIKEKKPYVICMSSRGNKIRRKEFFDMLNYWGIDGVMMNMPDIPHSVWLWKLTVVHELKKIKKHIKNLKEVYTHNNKGESGHPHHFALSNGVQKVFSDFEIIKTAETVPDNCVGRLSDDDIKEKEEILYKYYPSQTKGLAKWCSWWDTFLTTEYFER